MFKAILSALILFLKALVSKVCTPLNVLITIALPDLSQKIIDITSVFSSIFYNMSWALGLIPDNLRTTLLFILTIEIAKHTIYVSTHVLIRIWNIFQKLKFW